MTIRTVVVAVMVVLVGMAGVHRAAAAGAALATPQLGISASPATSVGLQITVNSNLTGGAAPTGTITFNLFGPGDVSCGSVLFTSTVAVSGTSMNSAPYTTLAAGTYRWQSTYNGDANNNRVGPTACSSGTNGVIVDRAGSALNLIAPAAVAGAIRGSATLLGGYKPTGTLSFFLSPPGDSFCSTSVYSTTVPVNLGAAVYVTAPYTPTVSGTYTWRASYSGDANTIGVSPTNCLDNNAKVTVNVSSSPGIGFSPGTVSFAAQAIPSTSASQTVTVTDTGNAALAISSVTLSGANPGDYRTSADTCTGTSVAPGGHCSVAVSFVPAAAGTRTAALTVADNAAASPQAVTLTGTGTATQALMTYPTDGQVNVDTTRAFSWATVAAAQGHYLIVGTTALGYDVVNSGVLPATQLSLTVPPMPAGTLYATLYTELNGTWTTYQAITFTAVPRPTTITWPSDGQVNVDTTRPFTWSAVPGAGAYDLMVGTTPNGYDLVSSGSLPVAQTSLNVGRLPSGSTLHATLFVQFNGTWMRYQAITFTAAARAAAIIYPTNGQANVDTRQPFSWSGVADAQAYYLMVGTTPNGYDLVNSGSLPTTQTSMNVGHLPSGTTLYASFYVQLAGTWTRYDGATFTAAARPSTVTYPANGQAGVDTTRAITWTSVAGAQAYYVFVGTTASGYDQINSGVLPTTQSSLNMPALPIGTPLYLTLCVQLNGVWTVEQTVTFTAAPGMATLTNPADGQVVVDTTRPITWTTIPGAQGYYLVVGTAAFGNDLVNTGVLAPSQSSWTMPSLPAGRTLYATLLTEVNGSWSRYTAITFSR